MYLEKIEIQGFKSFAKKTILEFNGIQRKKDKNMAGITAIAGPNGSGKSNVADAVRWVLGEQSVKMLRGKKSEDIIFSGSAKKSRLSCAEVSLHLNNEDKQAPIDYSQINITRRVFRDGESEYILNNNKVRLLDISLLLAKAKFSQRAYSVIGQGMVDHFLSASLSERKEIFDEATGVKMYQIKRHDSLNKLKNAQNNLEQAETLLTEIEPRMRSLTRQIKKLEKRSELEKELQAKQREYYACLWHSRNNELKKINKESLSFEDEQREQEKQANKLNQDLIKFESAQFDNDAREKLETEIKKTQEDRNKIHRQLAEAKARLEIAYEKSGQVNTAWLVKKQGELKEEIEKLKHESTSTQQLVNSAKQIVDELRNKQTVIDEKLVGLRKELIPSEKEKQTDDNLQDRLKNIFNKLISINKSILQKIDAGENLTTVKKDFLVLHNVLEKLRSDFGDSQSADTDRLIILNKEISNFETQKKDLTEKYIQAQSKLQNARNQRDNFNNSIKDKQDELISITEKIKKAKNNSSVNTAVLKQQQQDAEKELAVIDKKLSGYVCTRQELDQAERKKQNQILDLQQKAHEAQNKYNTASQKLNEIKINKARVETKLEDLEREIRHETNNLRVIIDTRDINYNLDKKETWPEIEKLKRQLELIGGIDPEIKVEHDETKERFEFLSKQSEDLNGGIKSLNKIVAEFDKTIAEKFDKAFDKIAKEFEDYFQILFDGGSAQLVRVMEDANKADDESGEKVSEDKAEDDKPVIKKKVILRQIKQVLAGIDITACPPGKKIKNISMLSGGERSLTAIALICAIISVNPAPFVVLDEVDAALDEANSVRFGKILEKLSHKTQFIVITHNRTIMHKADIIYGVTMGDEGISKLLSMKFENVSAARR